MSGPSLLRVAALATGVVLGLAVASPAMGEDPKPGQEEAMKIRIDIEGVVLTATLEDNRSARDFVSLLPLTVTLADYASTEKIADLPGRLSTADAPVGIDPAVGDVTYYAPWGNLAIFYKDFGYSRGLVRLGRIEGGVDALHRPGRMQARIEVQER